MKVDPRVYLWCLALVAALIFCAYLFTLQGCPTTATECVNFEHKPMEVISSEIKPTYCYCGHECASTCYPVSFKLEEPGSNSTYCTWVSEDYDFESEAEDTVDKYPPGSLIKVWIDKRNHKCQEDDVLDFIFGVGVFLMIATGCCFMCVCACCSSDIQEDISNQQAECSCDYPWNWDPNPNNWLKHRAEPRSTIHKAEIVVKCTRLYLLLLYSSSNSALFVTLIGSASLNAWGLRNGNFDYVGQHLISLVCIQSGTALVILYNILRQRRRLNNLSASSVESLCVKAAVIKFSKIATCILSINIVFSSHWNVYTGLSILWNIIAILLCLTQPYLMALVFMTMVLYIFHALYFFQPFVCYAGDKKYLDFLNMYRWVREKRSQEDILATLLPPPKDNSMLRAIIAAHIVNTKVECTGNKLDRNDPALLEMFDIRKDQSGATTFVLNNVDIFQPVNECFSFLFVPRELQVNFSEVVDHAGDVNIDQLPCRNND